MRWWSRGLSPVGRNLSVRAMVIGVSCLIIPQVGVTAFAETVPPEQPETSSPPADPTPPPTEGDPAETPTATTQPSPTTVPTSEEPVAPTTTEPATTTAASAPLPYVVSFASGTSAADQAAAIDAAGATSTDTIAVLRIHAVNASDEAAAALRANPAVSTVELDRSRAVEATPNDPSYADQWALPMIGWDQAFGTIAPAGSAVVAILDTGVDATNPDIDGNIVAGTSFVAGSPWSSDPNGHGTAMAGIVAAETDNGSDIAGVGYAGVSVMPVTVLSADGLGRDSDIIEGVVWAADHGADVILMSFSASSYSSALQAAVDYAWSRDVVLVAAAGNDSASTPAFPAGDAGVIGVASTSSSDALAGSSNFGDAVFLAAPGEDIITITGSISGTSAAAAHVAGAAALLAANDSSASNGMIVGRLARNADAVGTASESGNGRLNLARALTDVGTDSVKPAGAAPVGTGGPFVGPYVAAANNDAHVAPGWAPTNTVTTFSTLYRKTTGGTVQHVRVTLPAGYTNISVAATAFSSGTWSTPVVNQVARTVDVQLTSGTGLATNSVSWARIDITATTPPAAQSGGAAVWLMQTFTNTAGTAGEQNDNPPVLIGTVTNPAATITFVDAAGTPIDTPVLQNGIAATVRLRVTSVGSGIKYTDVAVPTCFSSPSAVTATVSAGGNAYDTPILITDGFIRMSGGSIANNGTLTVQFTTTPNCVSGTYLVSSDPSTNASNPPSGTNQSVSTTGGSLTIAGGLADLSITKTDSPDPVAPGGSITYTIGVNNAGPNDASAVKVVDTLPTGTTFSSATGTNWNCVHVSGTVTCNRTGGNLAPSAAPNITVVVTNATGAPGATHNNGATVSSPNDNTPGNNTAAATTTVNTPPVCANDSSSTNEDTELGDTVVCTDVNVGQPLTYSVVTTTTNGVLTFNANGSFTYQPGPNYNGSDSFTFRANDGIANSNTATYSITVNAVNDAPAVTLSAANNLTVNEGTNHTYNFTVTDVDAGATFAVVSASCGANGTQVGTTTTTASGGSFVCSFPDGPSSSAVSIQVKDDANANSNTATQTVTVANVKPSIVLTGSGSADEGDTKTYSFTVTDPGADTHTIVTACGVDGTKVVLSDTYNAITGVGSFECFFADGPATTNVTATVTDSDGASDTDNQVVVVTVSNVAPTVTLSGANDLSVFEGSSHTYGFTSSDPGEDSFSVVAVSCGLEGVQVGLTTTTASGGSFVCSFPDGPNDSVVSVQVKDSDEATSNVDSQTVVVANVSPTVTLTGDDIANEGTTHLYSFTTTDPGDDGFAVVSSSCGVGGVPVGIDTFDPATGSGSFSCRFPDGPGSSTVSVRVEDSDGAASNLSTVAVTIANVAPTVTLSAGNTLTVNEGTSHTYSFTVSDAGADTFSVVVVSCGANGTQVGVTSTTTSGGSFVCNFPNGPASSIVSVQVEDSDDANSNTATQTVTINNVVPAAVTTTATPGSIQENNSTTLNGSFTDSGAADTHTVVINWGDGSPNTSVNLAAGVLVFSGQTHQYMDDNPTATNSDIYTITVTVTDNNGASGSGTTTVTVNNEAPVASITGPASASIYAVGTPVTFTGTFTDQGTLDTHDMSCTTAWACTYWQLDTIKKAATVTEVNGSGTATATYTFSTPGVYSVTLYVRDDDGGIGAATTVNGFNAMVVIYDPNAGFVTGGGYLTHQAPWTTPPITTAGKDNFGFVAKYKKGASTPEGETEFQCKVCNINFHSTSLDWLVVTSITTGPNAGGQKAWYQGSGTINGLGDYRFQVTFIDKGTTDYFRIQIWNKSTNAVVYDNMPTAPNGTEPVTLTQGGNLVIHK